MMLQAKEPGDFVVATGTQYSVTDFLRFSFEHVGLDWEKHVAFDEKYLRPAEVDALVGDSEKVRTATGWNPSVMTPELAQIMVDADQKKLAAEGSVWIDKPF